LEFQKVKNKLSALDVSSGYFKIVDQLFKRIKSQFDKNKEKRRQEWIEES